MATVLKTMLDILTAGNKEEETERKDGHITSILLVTSFSAIVFACFGEFYTQSKYVFSISQYNIALLIMLGLILLSLLIWILLCCVAKYRSSSCLSVPRNDPVCSIVCILYGIFGLGKMINLFLIGIIQIGCYKQDGFDAVTALECVFYYIFVCSDNFHLAFFSISVQAKFTYKLLSFRYLVHKCCVLSLEVFCKHLRNTSDGEKMGKSYH